MQIRVPFIEYFIPGVCAHWLEIERKIHAGFDHLDYENVFPGRFQKVIAMLVMLAVFSLSILLTQIGLGWRAFTCTAMFEEQKSGEKERQKHTTPGIPQWSPIFSTTCHSDRRN